ncbi:hypothetical protein V5P93_006851 [Actinokineospora auranticolor]|uniref:Uncharacterized protein n=1 Tax=Actinokineospora auranticolor TaxID=155976 RepID=A0A2S6GW84_9PSEU|nr:hypothetical protein [Actinokineospora auranticolor]PPK69502.1 hypothetical protein CLV40_103112 [Actinokineospora auranticolor]
MDQKAYDGLQTVVLLVGVWEGLIPFVAKIFGWRPFLAFPLHLPDPLWWIVSGAVIVISLVLLELLDRAKKQSTRES